MLESFGEFLPYLARDHIILHVTMFFLVRVFGVHEHLPCFCGRHGGLLVEESLTLALVGLSCNSVLLNETLICFLILDLIGEGSHGLTLVFES